MWPYKTHRRATINRYCQRIQHHPKCCFLALENNAVVAKEKKQRVWAISKGYTLESISYMISWGTEDMHSFLKTSRGVLSEAPYYLHYRPVGEHFKDLGCIAGVMRKLSLQYDTAEDRYIILSAKKDQPIIASQISGKSLSSCHRQAYIQKNCSQAFASIRIVCLKPWCESPIIESSP